MSFTFENQGTHTYLAYHVAEDDIIDSMSLGMLTNNKISGLAHTLFMQMDSFKFIKYDVSAKVSVKQFFMGPVTKKRLLGVFHGIVDALLSAEDYMIDVNSILLDLDYIFADVSTCETVLICLPIENHDEASVNLGTFFKNIMFSTQFDQTENCDYVAKIINYLNSSFELSLLDFKKILESIENVTSNIVMTEPVSQPQVAKNTGYVQPSVPNKPQMPMNTVNTSVTMPSKAIQQTSKPIENPTIITPKSPENQKKPEKKMSMLYLLRHYSKENAAIYKAQKAEESAGKAENKKETSATKNQSNEFAIPGEKSTFNAEASLAIPGQTSSEFPTTSDSVGSSRVSSELPSPVITRNAMPQGQSMNFGETTVLGNGNMGETTVLGGGSVVQNKPYLLRIKNNEKINVDKPVFRIGKERSYVDYFIGDNSAISRSHANIVSRDGKYFVMDTNSTNHTYVNNTMIQSNAETEIIHGSKIRLANEDFEFKLY